MSTNHSNRVPGLLRDGNLAKGLIRGEEVLEKRTFHFFPIMNARIVEALRVR